MVFNTAALAWGPSLLHSREPSDVGRGDGQDNQGARKAEELESATDGVF